MKECLVLFSGGKDSFLSTIYLIEQGYRVILVHFDNGQTIGINNVKIGYKRLLKKYGSEKVSYIGTKNISCFFRNFIIKTYNMYLEEINKKYGNITISELNCLSCRLSMYVAAIIICIQNNIKYVADGARNSQLFAIEQDEMLNLFKKLFKKYSIELLLPLKDLINDFEEKNEFIIRGFVPKVNESQCLIGIPLSSNNVDQISLKTCQKIYKELYEKIVDEIIQKQKNTALGERFI